MSRKFHLFLCLLVQLILQCRTDLPPPEILARMEDQAMSSIALRSLEEMVEKDNSVKDVKSRLLAKIPEHMLGGRVVIGRNGEAFYEPDVSASGKESDLPEQSKNKRQDTVEKFIVIESSGEDGEIKEGEETAKLPKLTAEESRAVQYFVEALAEEIATELPKKPSRMDFAASENSPSYKPRFDYDSYSKDSLETKLSGKTYWKDSDESKNPEARVDEDGCTMVVKKFRDPADSKEGSPVKSVLVTKECVYPDGKGPDARIQGIQTYNRQPLHALREKPKVRVVSYERQSLPVYNENVKALNPPIYSSTPESKQYSRDPLKSDYIDKMLEEHFKDFPNFRTTTSAVEEIERKLKSDLKDVGTQDKAGLSDYSYEQGSPIKHKSGPVLNTESNPPKVYEHHYDHHHTYPNANGRPVVSTSSHTEQPSYREQKQHHHPHGGHSHQLDKNRYSPDEGRHPTEGSSKPKMLKKSFAYYRKDNPKTDPDNQQYAEEYAHGNYRSFSTDYDSDRDGPEKTT